MLHAYILLLTHFDEFLEKAGQSADDRGEILLTQPHHTFRRLLQQLITGCRQQLVARVMGELCTSEGEGGREGERGREEREGGGERYCEVCIPTQTALH